MENALGIKFILKVSYVCGVFSLWEVWFCLMSVITEVEFIIFTLVVFGLLFKWFV